MKNNFDDRTRNAVFNLLLGLGDDRLILGHRISEWCGHAPLLEEDIALTNIALDCIGQANAFLSLAAEIEDKGRTEDSLAYLRDERSYKNFQLVEQPNDDFAYTIARQFFYDVYSYFLYDKLQGSNLKPLKAIAAKSLKEVKYHLRHSKNWILRLGDGTDESRRKLQAAVDDLWIFTGELFLDTDDNLFLIEKSITVSNKEIKPQWIELVSETFNEATIKTPESDTIISGGRLGNHTECLGHILSEMQILHRSYPEVKW